MKFFFGIFPLLIVTLGAHGASKIEIYEIRDTKNGLQLRNLNSNPKTSQKTDPVFKLLRVPKTETSGLKFAKQLLKKLKTVDGNEKVNRYSDDAHIFVLNSDVLDADSSYEEHSTFVDHTRNDRVGSIDSKDIRDILLKLFQPEKKTQQRKRTLPSLRRKQALDKPALRTNNVIPIDVGTSEIKGKYKNLDEDNISEVNDNY